MAQAWIVRAGQEDEYEQEVLEQGVVAMGWRQLGDLTQHDSHQAINSLMDDAYAEFSSRSRQEYGAQLYAFRSRMGPGDYVVLLRRNAPDLAIGTVTGDYAYRPDLPAPHVRPVRWARTDVSRTELGLDLLAAPALTSIYRINRRHAPHRLAVVMEAGRDGKRTESPPFARPDQQRVATESAMDNVRRNLDYAYSLATAGQSLQDLKVQSFDVTDVYRAAWVQAVAALDHWVRLEIRERMLAQVERGSIRGAELAPGVFQLPAELAKQVLAGTLSARAAVYEHWRKTVERKTFHRPKVIGEGLAQVADVSDLWLQVALVLTERGGAEETYTVDALETRLRDVVVRRNKIAHEYDEDPDRPPAKRPIDLAAATNAINWIGQLTEAIAVVLDGKR